MPGGSAELCGRGSAAADCGAGLCPAEPPGGIAGRGAAREAHPCPGALRLLFAQPLAAGREERGEKGLNPARGDQQSAGSAGVVGGLEGELAVGPAFLN